MKDCIIWEGALTPDGYPRRAYRGSTNVRWHRVVCATSLGLDIEDIKGKVVMHVCDNPKCVNPKHLKLGNAKDNMLDRDQKGRHGRTKVTAQQVNEIRNSDDTNVAIARKYGIDARTVSSIRLRHHWKWC